MARCPYLEYLDEGTIFDELKYRCKLTCQVMYESDPRVKYTCKVDYGYPYENCQIYKDRR